MELNANSSEAILRMKELRIEREIFANDHTSVALEHDEDFYIELNMSSFSSVQFLKRNSKINLFNDQIRVVSICIYNENEERMLLSIYPSISTNRLLISLAQAGYRKLSNKFLKYLTKQGNSIWEEFGIWGAEISWKQFKILLSSFCQMKQLS